MKDNIRSTSGLQCGCEGGEAGSNKRSYANVLRYRVFLVPESECRLGLDLHTSRNMHMIFASVHVNG